MIPSGLHEVYIGHLESTRMGNRVKCEITIDPNTGLVHHNVISGNNERFPSRKVVENRFRKDIKMIFIIMVLVFCMCQASCIVIISILYCYSQAICTFIIRILYCYYQAICTFIISILYWYSQAICTFIISISYCYSQASCIVIQ